MPDPELIPIVYADELPPCTLCGEPWCDKHDMHYNECPCIGPHNAEEKGYEIVIIDGKEFARKK